MSRKKLQQKIINKIFHLKNFQLILKNWELKNLSKKFSSKKFKEF